MNTNVSKTRNHVFISFLLISIVLGFVGFLYTRLENVDIPRHRYPLIDLNEYPLLITQGWTHPSAFSSVADYITGSILVPPQKKGRSQRIMDLGFSVPQSSILEVTFTIPFSVSASMYHTYTQLQSERGLVMPALFLASIGDNWEIYLNGTVIKSEIHIGKDGSIESHRFYKNLVIPFEYHLLKQGENLLTLHIYGSSALLFSGLYASGPYLLGSYDDLKYLHSPIPDTVASLLFIFVGIFIIISFSFRGSLLHSMYFGLFAVVVGLYLLFRQPILYYLIPDSGILYRVSQFSLCLVVPVFALFLESLHKNYIGKQVRFIISVYGILGLCVLILPLGIVQYLVYVWACLSSFAALYIFGYLGLWNFYNSLRTTKSEHGCCIRQFLHTLSTDPLGISVIGGLLFFGSTIYDIIHVLINNKTSLSSLYSFSIFILGGSVILSRYFKFIFDQLSTTNSLLAENIEILKKTQNRAKKS
ncbi:MAG: hypothetical protein SNJ56_01090 [Termitinemataceae bacterium]